MVKLLRTDTTLDLSQKARVVRISSRQWLAFIGMGDAHEPFDARDLGTSGGKLRDILQVTLEKNQVQDRR